MGRNKAGASLGLSDLPWQGNVGVTALTPIRPRLPGNEVLLLEGGTRERAVPPGSLLMAGVLGLPLRNCFGAASSLSSEKQPGVQGAGLGHLLVLHMEVRPLQMRTGATT